MNLTLQVWRQPGPAARAAPRNTGDRLSPDMSFLEMLDVVNEGLIGRALPIAFDHDCREGICGSCGMMINGVAHGPSRGRRRASCTCARSATATRSSSSRGGRGPFLFVRDLVVNRSALIGSSRPGLHLAPTGSAQDANALPVPKHEPTPRWMRRRAWLRCLRGGLPERSASLFTGAKISHLGLLPQGQPERYRRALNMVTQMDLETSALHAVRRMPGGVPQGNQHRRDLAHEPRLPARRRDGAARQRPGR